MNLGSVSNGMSRDLFQRTPDLTGSDAEAKRGEIRAYFIATFERYEQLFEVLTGDEAYFKKPIALRHPLIFYLGHTATFFIKRLVIPNPLVHLRLRGIIVVQ